MYTYIDTHLYLGNHLKLPFAFGSTWNMFSGPSSYHLRRSLLSSEGRANDQRLCVCVYVYLFMYMNSRSVLVPLAAKLAVIGGQSKSPTAVYVHMCIRVFMYMNFVYVLRRSLLSLDGRANHQRLCICAYVHLCI
jgi:hypothetical protein